MSGAAIFMSKLNFKLIASLVGVVALVMANAALASGIQISDDKAEIDIQLGSGLAVEVSVGFENVIGLSADSLGISARVISPLDSEILSRLPVSGNVGIASEFPVVVSIEPPQSSGLSFTDAYDIELHTHNLHFLPDSGFRLMKSEDGGPFMDISESVGAGSVRARGRSGGFSEFIIAYDLRPLHEVTSLKFAGLETRILEAGLDSTIETALLADLSSAENLVAGNDPLGAISALDQLLLAVENSAGNGIPNVWRSSRDLDNVAGDLIGQASSLRYTLGIAHTANLLGSAIGGE